MRSKEFVQEFELGIVHGQVGVMLVVIRAIKEESKNAGCLEVTVSTSTIPSMQGKVHQMKGKCVGNKSTQNPKDGSSMMVYSTILSIHAELATSFLGL